MSKIKEKRYSGKEIKELLDAAEMLWVVLASGGDWTKQGKEWQKAARKWNN